MKKERRNTRRGHAARDCGGGGILRADRAETGRRRSGGWTAATKRAKPTSTKPNAQNAGPGCSSLQDELQDFLKIQNLKPSLVVPKACNTSGGAPEEAENHPAQPELAQRTAHLKFVVATLPDPVHTHLPVLFDQFAVAIQEGAQDEKYDFDSAWLPWDITI